MRLVVATMAVPCLGFSIASSASADPGSVTGSLTSIEMMSDDPNGVVVGGKSDRIDGHWYLRQGAASSSVWWFAGVSADPRSYTCMPNIQLDGQPAYQGAALIPQQVDWPPPRYLWHYDKGGLTTLNTPGFRAFVSKVRDGEARIDFDCGALGRASWSISVSVIPAPPADRTAGVSINDGADFVNTPGVRLFLGWEDLGDPEGLIDRIRVSNDGGFAPSKTQEITLPSADSVAWKLVKLGNERIPRQVYVKFHEAGGGWLKQVYSDDIVLDTVKPTIQSAQLTPAGVSSISAARAVLKVRARDNRSGVKAMQIRTGAKKSKIMNFRKRVLVPQGAVRVRVRDGAGNWSGWTKA